MDFIDLKTQQKRIRDDLESRIRCVLDHGQYILGPEVFELEDRLKEWVGVKHAVAVSSGTDALLIALMALGIGPGDEVITVPYTWISTAEVIALVGADPVFVDIDEKTWNMNPDSLREAITPKTRAIIPVGIYGQTADMNRINQIALQHGDIPVIEDAAQSLGATYHGRKSGALSLVGTTSFFPSKPLGGYGEGGAVFTDDPELAEKARMIRVHGQMSRNHHPVLGMNARLNTIQAAVLLAKLEIFPEEIGLREAVARRYDEGLAGIPGIEIPIVAEGCTSVFAQYTILCDDREKIRGELAGRGIPSVSYYAVPLHLQPVFSGLGYRVGDFPVAERVADHGLSLPMSPYLGAAEQQRIVEAVAAAANR